jgi:ketosteroid isomerase-like protein
MSARCTDLRPCVASSEIGSTCSTTVTNVPEELLDLRDDRVVTVQRATGRAKTSGVQTEIRFAVVYTLRDGKILRGREYIDRKRALEAAGLGE